MPFFQSFGMTHSLNSLSRLHDIFSIRFFDLSFIFLARNSYETSCYLRHSILRTDLNFPWEFGVTDGNCVDNVQGLPSQIYVWFLSNPRQNTAPSHLKHIFSSLQTSIHPAVIESFSKQVSLPLRWFHRIRVWYIFENLRWIHVYQCCLHLFCLCYSNNPPLKANVSM